MATPLLDWAGFFRRLGRRSARIAQCVDRLLRERAERNVAVSVDDRSAELGGRPFELCRVSA